MWICVCCATQSCEETRGLGRRLLCWSKRCAPPDLDLTVYREMNTQLCHDLVFDTRHKLWQDDNIIVYFCCTSAKYGRGAVGFQSYMMNIFHGTCLQQKWVTSFDDGGIRRCMWGLIAYWCDLHAKNWSWLRSVPIHTWFWSNPSVHVRMVEMYTLRWIMY